MKIMDEISIWRERIVQNFPHVEAEKIRIAFDEGLKTYRGPQTRYKFRNPYHIESYSDEISEQDCLSSAWSSGWAAGSQFRKLTVTHTGRNKAFLKIDTFYFISSFYS